MSERSEIVYRGVVIITVPNYESNGLVEWVSKAEHTRGRTSEEIHRRKKLWELDNPGMKLKGIPYAWATWTEEFEAVDYDRKKSIEKIKSQIDKYAELHPYSFSDRDKY